MLCCKDGTHTEISRYNCLKREAKKTPLQEFCANEDGQWGSSPVWPHNSWINLFCPARQDAMENHAGEVLWYQHRQSRQCRSKQLSCLFGVRASSKTATWRPSLYCFQYTTMFCVAAALTVFMESRLGMSQEPPPLLFLPVPSPPTLCDVSLGWMWKYLLLHHHCSLVYSSLSVHSFSFPVTIPRHIWLSLLWISWCFTFLQF